MVEFDNVSVSFDGTPVVRNVVRNVVFRGLQGQTTVLLGRSGSGKTTLLRLVNRMLLPGEGRVVVANKTTAQWDPIRLRRQTGYMIQDGGLLPHYTVARNVGLVPELEGWEPQRIRARVEELLELVGLAPAEYAGRMSHQLSGGQRQRVGVARALAVDPPLLLCDEPFGALDPITRSELQREFRRLARKLGKTILFVTHDVSEALYLADRVVLLEGGRVAVNERAEDFRRSGHPEARAFLLSRDPSAAELAE